MHTELELRQRLAKTKQEIDFCNALWLCGIWSRDIERMRTDAIKQRAAARRELRELLATERCNGV